MTEQTEKISFEAPAHLTLAEFNALDELRALDALERCCGAHRWVACMLAARPFASLEKVYAEADDIWSRLSKADYLEAFEHHPKIGDVSKLREKFASTAQWASGEQSGVNAASEETLAALAEGNHQYEERFGHIFIVCATGKSAGEMLELLQARLENAPDKELKIAAGEQAKITKIRLKKLLESAS